MKQTVMLRTTLWLHFIIFELWCRGIISSGLLRAYKVKIASNDKQGRVKAQAFVYKDHELR